MPNKVVNLSVPSPGIFGLNLEKSQTVLDSRWAIEANNLVFDSSGRIGARKGTQRTGTTTVGAVDIEQVHEYIDSLGVKTVILTANNKIYKKDGTSYTDISGTITTPTANNWKFVNFNGKCVGFQASHAPIVLATASGSFADISLSGTDQPTTVVNEVAAIGGRLFAIDGTNILASDSLDETTWSLVAIDLKTVWLAGSDVGTALAEFNDHLVIFGEKSIVVYADPWDPTAATFISVENIGGIGCIARDTVQQVGSDIWFLSNSGVRSLGRTIQEKSMPLRELTKNVRIHLIDHITNETKTKIRSTYSEREGFYLVSFPTEVEVYCLDVKRPLEDGSARVTKWLTKCTALMTDSLGTTYVGRGDG